MEGIYPRKMRKSNQEKREEEEKKIKQLEKNLELLSEFNGKESKRLEKENDENITTIRKLEDE